MLDQIPYPGETAAVLCAFTWASAVILFRRAGESIQPIPLAIFKNTIAVFLLGVTAVVFDRSPAPEGAVTSLEWVQVFVSGMIGAGLGDVLYFASLNRLGAGRQAIVDCFYSPFVVLCAVGYLGEPLGPTLLIAVGFVIAANLVGTPPTPGERLRGANLNSRTVAVGALMGIASMFFMSSAIVWIKPILERVDAVWATGVRLAGGFFAVGLVCLLRPALRREAARTFRPSRAWRFMIPAHVLCPDLRHAVSARATHREPDRRHPDRLQRRRALDGPNPD
ncbi:MAG: DMT family transporter [Planctomycetota bacterium]|jgi:drug/metabolite transporter (DMT)-like permease